MSTDAASDSTDFTGTWRYKLGLTLIVGGHVVLLAGVVLPALGGGVALAGALVLGGELIALSSIVFLGKAGFLAIKGKIFGVVKTGFSARVGRGRHYFGLALFSINVLTLYAIVLYAWAAFAVATPESAAPMVWGLDLEQQDALVLTLFLVGELSFVVSIYVLGADWWERFRRLIVWQPPMTAG